MKNYVAVPALCLLACCSVPKPLPAPAPPPVVARPAPTPLPAPPAAARWEDWPFTPGTWRYRGDAAGSVAMFVTSAGTTAFTMRCDPATRTIALVRAGGFAAATSMAFTTSAGTAAYAGQVATDGLIATTRGSDPYLDKIAFSRGRFVVAAAGSERLVLPAWAEVSRIIEDCR